VAVADRQSSMENTSPEELMAAYKQTKDLKLRNELVMYYASTRSSICVRFCPCISNRRSFSTRA
jgi:hypothetical protein